MIVAKWSNYTPLQVGLKVLGMNIKITISYKVGRRGRERRGIIRNYMYKATS